MKHALKTLLASLVLTACSAWHPAAASFGFQGVPTPLSLGPAVAVPANTSTLVWRWDSGAQTLDITWSGGALCVLSTEDGLESWVLGAGYEFTPTGVKVPSESLVLTCPSAITAYVAEFH
jgi:hypothetical protein